MQPNDFENQLLMGWDLPQWAVAIKRVGMGGTQMKYAERTRREYLKHYGQAPLAFMLIGVEPDGDYDLAAALFEQLEYGLEKHADEVTLDSSYGDHSQDDHNYSEGRKNVFERGV